MHVRLRIIGKPDTIIVVESKLTKIDKFRSIIFDKFDVDPKLQRLFYGGKLLEDGYTFHDYNIKLNDVIQLMVRMQPEKSIECNKTESHVYNENASKETEEKQIDYKDATSMFYEVGDLVDFRDREQGTWIEGKIVRIVYDSDATQDVNDSVIKNVDSSSTPDNSEQPTDNVDPQNHSEHKLSSEITNDEKSKSKGIAKYFSKLHKSIKKIQDSNKTDDIHIADNVDTNLLYKVQCDANEEDDNLYCKLTEIRPRAHREIVIQDLRPGRIVMINHNTEDPLEKGYWYDFKIQEIKKSRSYYELVGTLYLGPDAVPQNDTKIKVLDKIFAIEDVVPLKERTEQYKKIMVTPYEKRSLPLNCLTCRDDEEKPCKDCGCFLCSGKESPEKIVLCDECNNGYHMQCLTPPLAELPEEDWYCPSCKRDPNDVIAPGAGKQSKKATASKSNRDWGRGMACVGKTKTCAMPANHFGPIPGIEVGMCWRFRIQLSESGVHRPPVSGIHGRDVEGAYSIVLSGGYEDDVDNGYEFTYTGSGGRDLSGNKRTAEQSCDQTLTRENKALARNCAVKQVNEEGDDAGDNWRNGKPVRVVRSFKMLKHFPKYAPKEGIRYDGIYKVVKYYPEKGLSGYRVWKYLLRRDDPSPAPWEAEAKQYSIIYPDGYLEAEAEKRALKEKNDKGKGMKSKNRNMKKALKENNQSTESDCEESPPVKKRRIQKDNQREPKPKKKGRSVKNKLDVKSPKGKPFQFTLKSPVAIKSNISKLDSGSELSTEEKQAIEADILNKKLWDECLEVCKTQGKKDFIEHVSQVFLCIICQEVAVTPVTTPCLHNFCMVCIKLAFNTTGSQNCPCCRQSLAKYEIDPNEKLKYALRNIMTGYDAGKK